MFNMAAPTDFLQKQTTIITDCITNWGRDIVPSDILHICAKSNLKVCIAYNKYSVLWHTLLAIYGPKIYTAPYVMVWKQADPLREQVGGGWTL